MSGCIPRPAKALVRGWADVEYISLKYATHACFYIFNIFSFGTVLSIEFSKLSTQRSRDGRFPNRDARDPNHQQCWFNHRLQFYFQHRKQLRCRDFVIRMGGYQQNNVTHLIHSHNFDACEFWISKHSRVSDKHTAPEAGEQRSHNRLPEQNVFRWHEHKEPRFLWSNSVCLFVVRFEICRKFNRHRVADFHVHADAGRCRFRQRGSVVMSNAEQWVLQTRKSDVHTSDERLAVFRGNHERDSAHPDGPNQDGESMGRWEQILQQQHKHKNV